MTLILTIANASGVYQSSDYQLTDQRTGNPISDRAGSKQLQASFKGLDLGLAFTGIAAVGAGTARQRTVDRLLVELKVLPYDAQLQDICEALATQIGTMTRPYGKRGVLALILTVAAIGEPFRVAVISNVDWHKRPPEAKPQFTIDIHTITKPFHLISGYRDAVPVLQRHRLRALARNTGEAPAQLLDALADINAIAAKHSRGYVSAGCWVTSQVADGRVRRSVSRNIGQQKGDIPLLLDNFNLSEWIRENFRAAPGKEISLVQSAGMMSGSGDGTPLPAPTGEPRLFTLSGASITALLRSPAGDQCVAIDITQLECILQTRCNEEGTVPFAKFTLRDISPISRAFPTPRLSWPQVSPDLMIDDAVVPRGWEYSVGYWIDGDSYHVVIPQSSRAIRNLAFLGPEDEIVIVAPSTTLEFAWGEREDAPSATIHARVWWRWRLDGTRG